MFLKHGLSFDILTRFYRKKRRIELFGWIQLIDATHALNLSAGVSKSDVLRGRSLNWGIAASHEPSTPQLQISPFFGCWRRLVSLDWGIEAPFGANGIFLTNCFYRYFEVGMGVAYIQWDTHQRQIYQPPYI